MSSWFTSLGTLYHGLGGRWKLGGLLPAESFDEAVTKGQFDDAQPTVPFAFSALFEIGNQFAETSGLSGILPLTIEAGGAENWGTDPETQNTGLTFYLDTQRGTYWGDIEITVEASEIFDVSIKLATMDTSQCNSLVVVSFNDNAVADTEYTVSITASGGDHSVTRIFQMNIAEA
jgi:hypothetical protein